MSLLAKLSLGLGSRIKFVVGVFVLVLFALILPALVYNYYHTSYSWRDGHQRSPLENNQHTWVLQLLLNLCGYSSVLVPLYILVRYFQHSDYLQSTDSNLLVRALRSCVVGSVNGAGSSQARQPTSSDREKSPVSKLGRLAFCSVGLLLSYLLWGLLQERIMSIKYVDQSDEILAKSSATVGNSTTGKVLLGEHFKNSLFLEFMNRILAFMIALILLNVVKHPPHDAPVYKYSYNAFSNVMSSWFQYEALKYVIFPVQVLAKASKVIPVMLMGKLVSRRTYTVLEYATAAMLSLGLFMFLLSSSEGSGKRRHTPTTDSPYTAHLTAWSGFALMTGYLIFDAFTSNWQGDLFKTYHMSSIQMMAGANLFSVLFTSVSLAEQGGFNEAFAFTLRHPLFIAHICVLAVTSTVGQLFIYFTIDQFGPVTFTIIMTVRQAFAILLSCIVYRHPVHFVGIIGIVICFVALFLRIRYSKHIGGHGGGGGKPTTTTSHSGGSKTGAIEKV